MRVRSGLVGQRQQIHHQHGMLGVVVRHAHRLIDDRQLARTLLLRHRDPALDVAQRVEILVQLHLVARPDEAHEPLQLIADRIEDAPVAPHPGAARLGIRAAGGAEELLEHGARVVLDRERRGRRAPGDRVRVGAARTAVAVAHHRVRLDAELERGNLRLLRQLPRRHLVHRHRVEHVGAVRDLERHAGQERSRGARVVSAALDEVGRLVVEAADQQHPVPVLVERLQGRRELSGLERLLLLGEPVRHRHAVRDVENPEPADGRRGGPADRGQRRHHAVQQGQRNRGAESAQHRTARQRLLGDEHP